MGGVREGNALHNSTRVTLNCSLFRPVISIGYENHILYFLHLRDLWFNKESNSSPIVHVWYIENTRWVSFDIKLTRQGFENACWHREACRDIENTRWVSFDIKFTRQGFENACWHREACRDIENTMWVSFEIKFTRQGFENACWHREAYRDIENTRWVSFDIKFTRQGFENACWHREACQDIENTRWVSFDIKFTRQGFENACWHRKACRAIQHEFSKPSLVNLISKAAILVFYLSVTLFKLAIMTFFLFLCWFSVIGNVIQKVQRHHDLIKALCCEIGNVY